MILISKKDVIGLNKELSNGAMINESSLDYAVKVNERSMNWIKTAAIFTRSILIDHVFEDGNKRTAAAVVMLVMDINKVDYDPARIPNIIIKILKNNINSIREIERCIKDGIRSS